MSLPSNLEISQGKNVIVQHGDIPLLREVRNSRFVSRDQLFWFLNYVDPLNRYTYNSRFKRLLEWEYIQPLHRIWWKGFGIYSIARSGSLALESRGDLAFASQSAGHRRPEPTRAFHALELNEIRLALIRSSLLAGWESRTEIGSGNTVLARFKHDHSALVRVRSGAQIREFVLVYERSVPTARRSKRIREALKAERGVAFLCLTTSPHLIFALLCHLTPNPAHLAFATARQFCGKLLATQVLTDTNTMALDDFLATASS